MRGCGDAGKNNLPPCLCVSDGIKRAAVSKHHNRVIVFHKIPFENFPLYFSLDNWILPLVPDKRFKKQTKESSLINSVNFNGSRSFPLTDRS